MSNYINFDYYYLTFDGNKIPQNEFEKYATKASNEVRIRIMNKPIIGFENQVQNVTCLVAELLYNQTQIKQKMQNIISGTEKIITSEKVGDYSRNFSNVTLSELQKELDSTAYRISDEIEKSLLFTGLLYSGVVDVR